MSNLCPHCNCFLFEDFFGGSRRRQETATTKRRSTAVGGAESVEKKDEWRERPTGYGWYKQVSVPVRQTFFKRVRHRKVCVKT